MRRAWLIAALLVACNEDPEPAESPPIRSVEEPTERSSDAPEGEGEAPPRPDEPAAPVADDTPPPDGAPEYFLYSDLSDEPPLGHPDPTTRRILDGLLTQHSRDALRGAIAAMPDGYDEWDDNFDESADGGCQVSLLHEHVLAITCSEEHISRMDRSQREWVFHYAMAGGEVWPIDPLDSFTSRDDVKAQLRVRCEAALEEAEEEGYERPYQADCAQLIPLLGPDGVSGVFPRTETTDGAGFEGDLELAYEDLTDLLAQDGLLDRLFTGRDPAPPTEPSAQDADGTAVSRPDLRHHLLARWQALDDAQRARVGLRRFDAALAQLVYVGDDAAAARAIATRLGATARRVDLEEAIDALSVSWQRTTAELNLRARANGPIVGVLPEGAIVAQADPSDRSRFVAVDTPIGSGWVGRNLLRAHAGCVPRAPDGFDQSAQPLTATVPIASAGAVADGVLFAQTTPSGTRVALHALDGSACAVGAQRALVQADGALRDVRLTRTAPNGGDTLVVVGTFASPSRVAYVAHAVGRDEAAWSRTVDVDERGRTGVRVSERADGSWFPVSFEDGRDLTRLQWTGAALEPRSP